MSPILDLQRRLHEAGRIRIGATAKTSSGKNRPAKLETFRFTSQSEAAMKHLATLFGGEVKPWADAPTGKQWELISESDAIRVMVPPEAMGFSQFYELWKAGGCERRCDGNEQSDGKACVCDPEERECKPHTRLSVMLTDMPTSGLWRLDTSGFYAATELAGGFELARLIASTSGRHILNATLRLEQREVKRPGQTVKKFSVPVLDFDVNPEALTGEAPRNLPGVTPVPALPAPTLREQMEAVENQPERTRRTEPVKATGLKPKPVAPVVDEEPKVVDMPAASNEVAKPEPPSSEPDLAADFAAIFNGLTGEAQSVRWMVLRSFGWDSGQGNDILKWAKAQSKETLNKAFDKLMETQEKVRG